MSGRPKRQVIGRRYALDLDAPGVRIEVASPWEDVCEDGASPTRGAAQAHWNEKPRRRMLKTYSDEFKNSILVRLLPPPQQRQPAQLVKETGKAANCRRSKMAQWQ